MSRTKILPDDVKKGCIALVQGYDRRRKDPKNALELHRIRAVEYAVENIGKDLDDGDRQLLIKGILQNCVAGRKYPFEKLGIDIMERTCFYDRRTAFLADIAKFMGLI